MMTGVGTFELVYTGQNSMGCINSDTATIEVISAPDVSVMEDISVCEDSNVISLSATSTEAGGGLERTGHVQQREIAYSMQPMLVWVSTRSFMK